MRQWCTQPYYPLHHRRNTHNYIQTLHSYGLFVWLFPINWVHLFGFVCLRKAGTAEPTCCDIREVHERHHTPGICKYVPTGETTTQTSWSTSVRGMLHADKYTITNALITEDCIRVSLRWYFHPEKYPEATAKSITGEIEWKCFLKSAKLHRGPHYLSKWFAGTYLKVNIWATRFLELSSFCSGVLEH